MLLALVVTIALSVEWIDAAPPNMLDGNLQVVDLSDLISPLPRFVDDSTQILSRTQDWEHSSWKNPNWPSGGGSILGYSSLVKNTHGQNPDGKYYLYYGHHDPMSGIGLAVADSVTGPYTKFNPSDNKVLTVPNYRPWGPNPDDPSHYSSPSVVWNADTELWTMYFHYYNHYHGQWTYSSSHPGQGWQMTAMATTPNLSDYRSWSIYKDPSIGQVSVWNIVPVHPTTDEAWSKEASAYNAVQRLPHPLPNGHEWLVFLRGTNASNGRPTVGFGSSSDGKNWDYFPENPTIARNKPWTVNANEYRPKFIGYLGANGSGEHEYLVAWSEHSHPRIIYSKTTDFVSFERDSRGYAQWGEGEDGIVSAWREDDTLYLFTGQTVHTMNLPVRGSSCDFNADSMCNGADLNQMYEETGYDLVDGIPALGLMEFDLNVDNVIDNQDIDKWLAMSATENGYTTPYQRGDTRGLDRTFPADRTVSLFDYNVLAGSFDPLGLRGPHLWSGANFNGDAKVDLSDYNSLTANFSLLGSYGAAQAIPEPTALVLVITGLLTAVVARCGRRRDH